MSVPEMSVPEMVERLLGVESESERRSVLSAAFSDSVDADDLLSVLKAEADRQWTISPHASLRAAEALILGATLADRPTHHALGLMAKDDAFRTLGNYNEALV